MGGRRQNFLEICSLSENTKSNHLHTCQSLQISWNWIGYLAIFNWWCKNEIAFFGIYSSHLGNYNLKMQSFNKSVLFNSFTFVFYSPSIYAVLKTIGKMIDKQLHGQVWCFLLISYYIKKIKC